MFDWIKKLFAKKCEHKWEISLFQKLTEDCTLTYKCVRCGKYEQR